MSAQNRGGARGADGIEIGGVPRVDLLPPEVRAAAASRVLRRRLGVGLIGVVTVVVLLVVAASVYSFGNVVKLAAAQAETDELLLKQSQYIEVRQVQQELLAVGDARMVGAFTEVQWREYLQDVQASLPASVTVKTAEITAASPFVEFEQVASPLQSPQIAKIVLEANSPTLPDVPLWLDGLAGLKGYAGASPDSVKFNDQTGVYTVTLTLHVNGAALAARFVPELPEATPTESTDGPATTGDTTAQGGN